VLEVRQGHHAGPSRGHAVEHALHRLRPASLTLSRRVLHLAKRFFGSFSPRRPDDGWATARLTEQEQRLWWQFPRPDRRHSIGVARHVEQVDPARPVVAAALLHDIGKVQANLSTFGRVFATVAERFGARHRRGRVGQYLRHDSIGADLLAAAGSDPLVVTWAREHHLPESQWTIPLETGRLLKAADDD
jgi:hypothetical protein